MKRLNRVLAGSILICTASCGRTALYTPVDDTGNLVPRGGAMNTGGFWAIGGITGSGAGGAGGEVPIAADGLVAYYLFSMDGQDASGHGNHATVTGPVPTVDRFGNANAAYKFNGIDDRIVRVDPVDLPSGAAPRTMAGWFRTNMTQQYTASLFGYGAAYSDANFELTIGPQSLTGYPVVFRVNGWSDSWDWRTGVDPASYADGHWHHAAVTYDGTKVVFYLDGAFKASGIATYRTDPAAITIGVDTQSTGWPYTGDLDDVMIFSRVLSSTEIATLAAN